ncbi:low molecular weight phosphotyrosine protein phosphatase [Flavobacterium sp. P4023]|uniref:protein-tyrosine-phosphatase n=1 Tax=Flavobacterium flabelliforme TaxID=2816119 RepID=A0ABS5CPA3_9FLAO|nr:low molecular weight protein-tyrosine-phosphatase [Flavobacterium flabelliforme]MBP4140441.1 low molecular weight phosphotyrosine protein phosphatase [Flavobacterium flabelliforme]
MPIKILMVCLGNICRSPLAQGILASKLPKDKFLVDSAGTGAWHVGHSPDERSITVAKKNQINISEQRGRQFSTSDFDTFDYIYVMDSNNYSDVLDLAKTQDQKDKVQMILNDLFPNENVDVPDPYFGLPNGFEIVYNMLDEVCDVISEKLIQKHQ